MEQVQNNKKYKKAVLERQIFREVATKLEMPKWIVEKVSKEIFLNIKEKLRNERKVLINNFASVYLKKLSNGKVKFKMTKSRKGWKTNYGK